MAVQNTTGYIRVTHTGVTKNSIYLKDLDGEINRGTDRQKVPCYVPFQGSIDVLLCDRTLASLKQGDIAGFVSLGYVKAFVVRNLRSETYEEITYSGSTPTNSTLWTSTAKTSRIESVDWFYSAGKVSYEIKTQYDENDQIVEQIRFDFVYAGNKVVSITETIL